MLLPDWLGIDHLFELSRTEAIAGFFTPLAIFALFALAQAILPAWRVPSYVIDPETGQPRNYRLNGILVFALAVIVWATEVTGMPRDWFYRSSVYAVAGGTVFTTIFALVAVFSLPQGEQKNPIAALWTGRAREISFFGDRKILYSGLWGVARHFNFLGEGFLSLSVALSFGHFANPWAWIYFVFIVTLFTFRQRNDDRYCAEKYGADKWAEYKALVKYRIFPGVY